MRRLRPFTVLLLAGLAVLPARAAEPAASPDTLPATSTAAPLARADTVAAVKRAVVAVGTLQPTRSPARVLLGTGFAVGDGRYILTNHHVIPQLLDESRREQLVIFTGVGDQIGTLPVKVLRSDPQHDLALLQIDGGKLPALALDGDTLVRDGEDYLFTGFPIGMVLGLYPVTSRGMVAALTPLVIPQANARQLDARMVNRLKTPYLVYQLDAIAYPGNSGSPLYRPDNGAVVGIINSVFVKETKEKVLENPSAIAYAIPVRHALALLAAAGVSP